MLKKGMVDIVTDGQWGSTGKGKLAGWLAFHRDYGAILSHFGPNAGHTVFDPRKTKVGDEVVTTHIPSSALFTRRGPIMLGAGSIIDPDTLIEEVRRLEERGYDIEDRLHIHPHAAIVTEECIRREKEDLQKISSTCKGTGAAICRRIWRQPESDAVAKNDHRLDRFGWVDMGFEERLFGVLEGGDNILIESAQGFDLSLMHGQWPYCTSRNVTPMKTLSDSGISHKALRHVYGCLRSYPIRVGNVYDEDGNMVGFSGPCYDDHDELSWDEVAERSGYGDDLQPEETTVTGKVRRVFTFSYQQLHRFIRVCGPDRLFINFVNYWDSGVHGNTHTVSEPVRSELRTIRDKIVSSPAMVWAVGTGPRMDHMVVYPEIGGGR